MKGVFKFSKPFTVLANYPSPLVGVAVVGGEMSAVGQRELVSSAEHVVHGKVGWDFAEM